MDIRQFFFSTLAKAIPGALLLVLTLGLGPLEAQVGSLSITLKDAVTTDIPPRAEPKPAEIKAKFTEKNFPLNKAANLQYFLKIIGPLTPAEKKFLEKNRFLVKTKPSQLSFRTPDNRPIYDEMLSNFDGLGGYTQEEDRLPHNARFVGPDIFLHALNKYVSRRIAAVEATALRQNVEFMLKSLFQNAKVLKASTTGRAQKSWERFMAQVVVPLVLVANWEPPKTETLEIGASDPDNLDRALKLFKSYQGDFSKATVTKIKEELKRIYKAEEVANSQLNLVPVGYQQDPAVIYTHFKPKGHYSAGPDTRAYFRAMVWLGYLGWDVKDEEGLTDALNFALAMSYTPPDHNALASVPPDASLIYTNRMASKTPTPKPLSEDPTTARQAWVRVMELNTFFLGYPDTLSYRQWLAFLMKEANVSEFKADTAASRELLEHLSEATSSLPSFSPYSLFNREDGSQVVVSIFPQNFTIPGLVTDQLTYRDGANERAPVMFSSLWIPVLLGQEYARKLIPSQIALSFGGGQKAAENEGLRNLVKMASTDILNLIENLQSKLNLNQSAPPWSSSLSHYLMRILKSLTAEFGSGYPLYMQSSVYPARQLESILGAYSEMVYDPILTEKNLPTRPAIKKDEVGPKVNLVKGFIEPNLSFWREMRRTTTFLASGFKRYGLFPEDLAEMGSLRRFQKRLERCTALAEKELQGIPLTADDYEFIRLFTLDWMAAPPGPDRLAPPPAEIRSAVLAPNQNFNLEGEQSSTVFVANGEPNLILVLVGNENSPRLCVGLSYNPYEFVLPTSSPLEVDDWEEIVYNRHRLKPSPDTMPLPQRNFWYDPLLP